MDNQQPPQQPEQEQSPPSEQQPPNNVVPRQQTLISSSDINVSSKNKLIVIIIIAVSLLIGLLSASVALLNNQGDDNKEDDGQALQQTQQDEAARGVDSRLTNEPYTDHENGFLLHYPSGWTTQTSNPSLHVEFYNDQPSRPNGFENINVASEPAPNFNLEEYVDANRQNIEAAIPSYEVTNPDRRVSLNNVDAYIISGSFDQAGLTIKNKQLITVVDSTGYVVTATALAENWNDFNDLFDASLLTFEVL